MADYTSFYGGRRGASFVIVKSYPSIAEMVAAFSQGGAYKTVNYDEYVLIDTVDKNDIDNGKIYRRGYEYNNELGGAVFVGQIVGPTGPAPQVEMKTYDEVEDIYDKFGPVDPETGDEYRKTSGEYAPLDNLIPGQYYDETGEHFNDSIQWVACSVRDEHSNQSTVHIGFIFPYLVEQYTAKSVSPYYHRSDASHTSWDDWGETGNTTDFENDELINRTDDLSHPYFQRWHIAVPKGIKGDMFQNLRVTTVGECLEEHPDWLQAYVGQEDDLVTIENVMERKILVYDYYHFDRDKGGDPVSIYLGDYNMIKNIEVDEEGTLTIDYTHDDEKVYKNLFKWIESVELNGTTGHFTVNYNYGGEKTRYDADLRWVNGIQLANDGTVTVTYTVGDDVILKNKIKWITKTQLDTDGTLTITYNDGTKEIFNKYIQWIKSIEFTDEGHLTINYNNGAVPFEKDIIWPVKFEVLTGEEEGEGSQKIKVTWNNKSETIIGEPLNYIMETVVDNRYHLLALYSDPARREAIIEAEENALWNGRDDWHDLGYIGDGTGVGAVAGKESDSGVASVALNMPPYSAWLIVEED